MRFPTLYASTIVFVAHDNLLVRSGAPEGPPPG